MTAADDLEVVAGNVERFPAQAVRHVVTGLRDAILPRARRDTGGDMILSHARPKIRLDVTTVLEGAGEHVEGHVIPGPRKALGQWRWLDDGTRPRVQGSGHHPGAKAKRTIEGAVDRALPELVDDVEQQWTEVTR